MTNYSGNQKGFIFVSCDPARRDEIVKRYLDPIEREDRALCLDFRTGALRRGDRSKIAKAHAVMIFLTKDFADDSRLEEIIDHSVEKDKPMLVVYLDDIELDTALTMQTDAQQALFLSRYENDEALLKEIKKAAIFDDMKVTPDQRKQQKRRIFIPLIAVTAVAAAMLLIMLRPAALFPDDDSVSNLGLPGVTGHDLKMIKEIHIAGNEVGDTDVDCEYEHDPDTDEWDKSRIRYWFHSEDGEGREGETKRGDISDLSGLERLRNLKVLELEGQQIEDINQLVEFYDSSKRDYLELIDILNWDSDAFEIDTESGFQLSLRCNPISSIDGLEKFRTLVSLDIGFTDVSEIPEGMGQLISLDVSHTKVSELPEDLKNLTNLNISFTDISELPEDLDLQELSIEGTSLTSVPDFKGKSDVHFGATETDLTDISNLATAESYSFLGLDADGKEGELIGLLKGMSIWDFTCYGMQINSPEELSGIDVSNRLELRDSSLTSLKGIEHFEGIKELCLCGCNGLTDLSAVNKLKSLKSIRLWQEQAYLADDVDDRIEVVIE